MHTRRPPGVDRGHTALHGDRADQEPLHALQGLAEAAARPHQPRRPLPGDGLRAHRRPGHPFLAPGGGWERPAGGRLQHLRGSLRSGHRLPGLFLATATVSRAISCLSPTRPIPCYARKRLPDVVKIVRRRRRSPSGGGLHTW